MSKPRANVEYHKFNTAGQPILMTCYGCQTRTLRFNGRSRLWTCTSCGSRLRTAEAIEYIALFLSGTEWAGARREVA